MPEVNINTVIRSARYGRLAFQWGGSGDDYIVNYRIDNSLEVMVGGKARHPWDYNNNDLVATRRQGRAQPSRITFRVKRSDLMGANELHENMLLEGTDGNVPSFTLKIELLDGEGLATGELIPFTNCTFEGGYSLREGEDHDEVPVEITSPDHNPTVTAIV